jgi:capsule polysaccharide export protein KpsC/LpsZ
MGKPNLYAEPGGKTAFNARWYAEQNHISIRKARRLLKRRFLAGELLFYPRHRMPSFDPNKATPKKG